MNIPCVGLSATLPDKTLVEARKNCGFRMDTTIHRHSVDRPNVFIGIDTIKESIKSMRDLLWFLPRNYQRPKDIRKTIIYMSSINEIRKALPIFRTHMRRLGYPSHATRLVRPYFSWMAEYDKIETAKAFEMRDEHCNSVRVLLATDAYGLGIDNPDVKLVIQWLVPENMESLWQRMGRAVRRPTAGSGRLLFLYPEWCREPCSSTETTSELRNEVSIQSDTLEGNSQNGKKKRKRKDTKRERDLQASLREKLDPAVRLFLNEVGCLRLAARVSNKPVSKSSAK